MIIEASPFYYHSNQETNVPKNLELNKEKKCNISIKNVT